MAKPNPVHIFAGDPIDRIDQARRDPGWIERQLARGDSRLLPFWNMKVLASKGAEPRLGWQSGAILEHIADGAAPVLLGVYEEVVRFALDVSGPEDPASALGLSDEIGFVEPLRIASQLPGFESGMLAHAKSVVDWHARNRFCASCGERTSPRSGGKERVCDGCGAQHFPRTDPVAIMVVHHRDRCLLGRSRRSGTGVYSALAGFIDQGESIEEAVRREVREEAGIRVGAVCYHSSQPWPYPSSLMIGCLAEALSTDIEMDDEELADVRWFTRAEVLEALTDPESPDRELRLPGPVAIAHHLLQAWVAGDQKGTHGVRPLSSYSAASSAKNEPG